MVSLNTATNLINDTTKPVALENSIDAERREIFH